MERVSPEVRNGVLQLVVPILQRRPDAALRIQLRERREIRTDIRLILQVCCQQIAMARHTEFRRVQRVCCLRTCSWLQDKTRTLANPQAKVGSWRSNG